MIMANFLTFVLFCVSVVILSVTNGYEGYFFEQKSDHFIRTNDSHFIRNGSTFLFNGFNSYWLMTVATQFDDRHKISDVFKEASSVNLSVCRTNAFSDGGNIALQISPGVYNEATFQALDFVISEAAKYGIHLILTFVNNWKEFGGKDQYIEWAQQAGVQINGEDDFYTNKVVKKYYKNHVKKVITRINSVTGVRYKDDSTIMAWELINEPRCKVDLSGNTFNGWAQEMASYVKSLDHKHLLDLGMEGFYGDSVPKRKQYNPGYQVGTDFIRSHQIAEVDFATIHFYTIGVNGTEDNQIASMKRWVTSHLEDAVGFKKPLVYEEFGKSTKEGDYSEEAREAFVRSVYNTTYNLAKQGGVMAGSMIWQLMAQGMDSYYDGYEIVLSQMPSIASIISNQSQAMASLSTSK